jgi:hypothetical protein
MTLRRYFALGAVLLATIAAIVGSTGAISLPIVGSAGATSSATTGPTGKGYWTVARDGGVFAFGGAAFHGSTGSTHLNQPMVGMAATPSGNGYWLVAADGGIFNGGDAGFYGSTGAIHLNRPIVGMASTPSGHGYWLVASDGGIFNGGDAGFYGSTGSLHLNQPVIGIAPTSDGRGYWLVASDGGIFAFGDAVFRGSMGGQHLNSPVVGVAADRVTGGYWLVASDGGVFAFGAPFYGSTGSLRLNRPVVGMSATGDGGGYWFVASDGGIFSFGDAGFYGSTGAIHLNQPVVGMAGTDGGLPPAPVNGGTPPTPPTTIPPPPPGTHKVLVIPEENATRAGVATGMPYLTSLGNQFGQATNYFAVIHPSLGDYLAMFAGQTHTQCPVGPLCNPPPPSVFGQTVAAHKPAKVYAEDMPTNCGPMQVGLYVPWHAPWPYFLDPTEQAACQQLDVPSGTTAGGALLSDIQSGNLPVTGEFAPNLDHDAHNAVAGGALPSADAFLQSWLPIIMAGPDYTRGDLTIIITFDEDDGTTGNNVTFVAIDPRLSHKVVSLASTHYSLARWLEDNAKVAHVNNAVTAPNLKKAFGI